MTGDHRKLFRDYSRKKEGEKRTIYEVEISQRKEWT